MKQNCLTDGCSNIAGLGHRLCDKHHRQKYGMVYKSSKGKKTSILRNRIIARDGLLCRRCGFLPEHESQIELDHRDGNHKNDDDKNLQLLCANCHRLKTQQEAEWNNEKYR